MSFLLVSKDNCFARKILPFFMVVDTRQVVDTRLVIVPKEPRFRHLVLPIVDITLRDMVCFQHTQMRDVLIVFVVHGTHLLRRTPSKVKEKNLWASHALFLLLPRFRHRLLFL